MLRWQTQLSSANAHLSEASPSIASRSGSVEGPRQRPRPWTTTPVQGCHDTRAAPQNPQLLIRGSVDPVPKTRYNTAVALMQGGDRERAQRM